ncbi:hypothetical protein [Candidatus Amarobacter glycogenicus]|uniref:hypothetical protein n=1 Tax=Candidatus Amarobacter glycogenicus TaxID=3140699 RepID=UPI002A13260D|nr:hypothetical protein [Dehalococcoidia bacterium]
MRRDTGFWRLLGGAPDTIRLMYPGQKEARFITLFREDAALEDLTGWLTTGSSQP